MQIVADQMEVSVDEMHLRTRSRPIVEARQLYFYLLRKTMRIPLYKIGARFNMNHATVVHGIKAVERRMDVYAMEWDVVNRLISIIQKEIALLAADIITVDTEVFQENDFYN